MYAGYGINIKELRDYYIISMCRYAQFYAFISVIELPRIPAYRPKIAAALGINRRYVGEEPTSLVTGIYNQIMSEKLPENGIECIIVPRKENDGKAISASTVRQALKEENWELLRELVPETTLDYFQSPEAQPVLEKICTAENVIHY